MRLPGAVGLVTSLVAGALLATGCTMCPDPFDYSGPVPNGSAPQNDFAARSNGILPLRSRPLPWPAVVDGDAPSATEAFADPSSPEGTTTDDAPASTPAERVATGEADPAESVTR
ncbi:MAG: hypothetical protein ACOYK7_02130 [Pirellulales bacterium]